MTKTFGRKYVNNCQNCIAKCFVPLFTSRALLLPIVILGRWLQLRSKGWTLRDSDVKN